MNQNSDATCRAYGCDKSTTAGFALCDDCASRDGRLTELQEKHKAEIEKLNKEWGKRVGEATWGPKY